MPRIIGCAFTDYVQKVAAIVTSTSPEPLSPELSAVVVAQKQRPQSFSSACANHAQQHTCDAVGHQESPVVRDARPQARRLLRAACLTKCV